jgi:sirohydrochlorin cobaltochelatase
MKKALLAVSFGTSYQDTLQKNIQAIEADLAAAFPERTVRRAFTSGMIIRKLQRRDGVTVHSVDQALAALADEGFDDVVIQSTHVMNRDEADKLRALAEPFRGRFARLALGAPLLTRAEDYQAAAAAILAALPSPRADWAVVLMGHGTEHYANAAYAQLEYVFHDRGRRDILVGTVEGYPGFEEVCRRLAERPSVTHVLLMPLMVVAGDHARNDLAGEEEGSWKSMLDRRGYTTQCQLTGLGENPGIRALFTAHAKAATAGA